MSQTVIDIANESQPVAGVVSANTFARWLDRILIGCLFALAFCAPHSIAATQAAWALGLLVWAVRFAVRPRPVLQRTPVDYALLGFFILTFISALLSYNPEISIGKLRAASLFTIVYLVAENVGTRRIVRLLALTLIASCMINVVYTLGSRAIGRGVMIEELAADSPLRVAGVREGDTVLKAGGEAISNLRELQEQLMADGSSGVPARLRVYRLEFFHEFDLPRHQMMSETSQLGVVRWSRGRDQRAAGFYGHYTTYAEVLQLIGSLALGLFVARRRNLTWPGVLLAVATAGIAAALLLTVTRASWLSFLISSGMIVLVGTASRKAALVVALAAVLLIPAGLYVLQQKRQVGFFDRRDNSITWRETVYREGFELLIAKPRHLLVGVGMDSLKRRWREWGMFDEGRLPVGHLHSTPLQIAFERGVPALLMWLALLFLYARMLWRLLARKTSALDWTERGIALGALGGAVGFFTSGLVHYNLGDSEVAMVFYLIMGLALALERFARTVPRTEIT